MLAYCGIVHTDAEIEMMVYKYMQHVYKKSVVPLKEMKHKKEVGDYPVNKYTSIYRVEPRNRYYHEVSVKVSNGSKNIPTIIFVIPTKARMKVI